MISSLFYLLEKTVTKIKEYVQKGKTTVTKWNWIGHHPEPRDIMWYFKERVRMS